MIILNIWIISVIICIEIKWQCRSRWTSNIWPSWRLRHVSQSAQPYPVMEQPRFASTFSRTTISNRDRNAPRCSQKTKCKLEVDKVRARFISDSKLAHLVVFQSFWVWLWHWIASSSMTFITSLEFSSSLCIFSFDYLFQALCIPLSPCVFNFFFSYPFASLNPFAVHNESQTYIKYQALRANLISHVNPDPKPQVQKRGNEALRLEKRPWWEKVGSGRLV